MSKQVFVADTILTAAQMNTLQGTDYNQTVSTKTASYTLVAADVGTKIVMNSASATTITVNTSLFSAGDTLTILNIAAGVTTLTAGTATVSSAGSLALSQYASGTLYFTSAGVSIFQADGVTAAASGLTLISRTTPSAATSFTFDSVFSSTYKTYLIVIEQATTSSDGSNLSFNLRYGSTTNTSANFYGGIFGVSYDSGTLQSSLANGLTSFRIINGLNTTLKTTVSLTVSGVGAASQIPGVICASAEPFQGKVRSGSATLQDAGQTYTGFIITNSAGNVSATVAIYGLATS